MSMTRSIIEVLADDGQIPDPPDGLQVAIKGVSPRWTTYGGFQWQPTGQWTESPDGLNPRTCIRGGLHVARTLAAAQSGGASLHHILAVAYDPAETGEWERDKRKVRRALTLAPLDVLAALRRDGRAADLRGTNLQGANLRGTNLRGTNLRDANLRGADLRGTNLQGANLRDADLLGANLRDADLRGTNLQGAFGAFLRDADLQGAFSRPDWDDLAAKGAIR